MNETPNALLFRPEAARDYRDILTNWIYFSVETWKKCIKNRMLCSYYIWCTPEIIFRETSILLLLRLEKSLKFFSHDF